MQHVDLFVSTLTSPLKGAVCAMLGNIRCPVARLLVVIGVLCGLAESGPIDNTCNSCTVNQADISCMVKELPYPCFLPEKEVKDFPHKPRNVTAKKHLENNSTWHLHVSWMLPYDFSYSVVSGFQMAVDSILDYVQIQTTRCYYFNLSAVDWSTVNDVHALEFRFDCLEYLATKNSRNLAITMYSLPKAAKNSEFTTVNVHLPKMTTVPQWAPKILMTPERDGLFVEFAPPFKNADYYRICVMDSKQSCVGGNQEFNNTVNRLFVPRVPRNHSYDVMVRPYQANGGFLDDWVSQRYFYPPGAVGTTVGPISEASSVEQLAIADNTQTIIVALGLGILALIVVALLYIALRKKWVFKRSCIEFQEERVALRSDEVEITPIFIQEQPFTCAVKHHLDLLEKIDGITVKETPIPSATGENNHQNTAWIDYQIRSFNNIKNKQILIYVSSRLLNSLDPTISRNEECDTVCNEFINRLAEKLRDGGKRPYIVCFGDVTPYTTALTQSLAMSRFKDLRSVVQCDGQRLNIDGTYSLIRDLTKDSRDQSFTAEELGEFRKKVSILLTQTTDSENVPYAHPNQTMMNCNGYSPINQVTVNCNGTVPQNENNQYCDGRLFSNCNGATSGYRTNDTTSPESVLLSMEESNAVEETFIAPSSIHDSCGNITEAFESFNQRACWRSEQY